MTKDELEKANMIQRDLVKLDSMKKHERFCVNGNHFESPIINEKIRSVLLECVGILSRDFKSM